MTGHLFTTAPLGASRFEHAWRDDAGGLHAAVSLGDFGQIQFRAVADARAHIGECVRAIEAMEALEPCVNCGHTGDDVTSVPSPGGGTVRYCKDAAPCETRMLREKCGVCFARYPGHELTCARHEAVAVAR